MILMRFLNRVHYQAPMSPLEVEMYTHIKNSIGIHPFFYEYIFMVDADTEVASDSLKRLVSSMVNDSRVGSLRLQNSDTAKCS
jgi:chitin synthase